jgi:hypothetical protein
MYGLKPEDITHLQTLEGKEITLVSVGQYDLHFNFHPDGAVSIEGRCEMLDQHGSLIDVWDRGQRSETFRFFDLLGQSVIKVEIDSPKSFTALLNNQRKLRVIDNSNHYESFSFDGLYV